MPTSAANSRRPTLSTPITFAPPRPRRLIPLKEVCQRTGRSRWWVRDAIIAGNFPAPVMTGARSVLFVEHEVDAWIDQLIETRDALRVAS